MAIAVSMMMAMGCRKVCVCMHARARQVQERVGEVEEEEQEEGGSCGQQASYISISPHSYYCHTSFPFPSHLDKTKSNDSLSEHSAHGLEALTPGVPQVRPISACLSLLSQVSVCAVNTLSLLAIISPLRLEPSHGRLHLTRPSLLCPIPPASQSSRHPHRMLQQSWRAWLGWLVEVWLWGSY